MTAFCFPAFSFPSYYDIKSLKQMSYFSLSNVMFSSSQRKIRTHCVNCLGETSMFWGPIVILI